MKAYPPRNFDSNHPESLYHYPQRPRLSSSCTSWNLYNKLGFHISVLTGDYTFPHRRVVFKSGTVVAICVQCERKPRRTCSFRCSYGPGIGHFYDIATLGEICVQATAESAFNRRIRTQRITCRSFILQCCTLQDVDMTARFPAFAIASSAVSLKSSGLDDYKVKSSAIRLSNTSASPSCPRYFCVLL